MELLSKLNHSCRHQCEQCATLFPLQVFSSGCQAGICSFSWVSTSCCHWWPLRIDLLRFEACQPQQWAETVEFNGHYTLELCMVHWLMVCMCTIALYFSYIDALHAHAHYFIDEVCRSSIQMWAGLLISRCVSISKPDNFFTEDCLYVRQFGKWGCAWQCWTIV